MNTRKRKVSSQTSVPVTRKSKEKKKTSAVGSSDPPAKDRTQGSGEIDPLSEATVVPDAAIPNLGSVPETAPETVP